MEAEKAHDLLSASWTHRKANGVIQTQTKGLRTRGTDGVRFSLSPKTLESGGWRCKSQSET